MNHELADVQAGFRKGRGTRDQLPTSTGSSKKQESSRKTSALLTMPKPLTVWITTNWKILKEMGIPRGKGWGGWWEGGSGWGTHINPWLIHVNVWQNPLQYCKRNLYAGQEATVRTGHGPTDWFQIGKGVHQGCILSPCLFNLYAEYIM